MNARQVYNILFRHTDLPLFNVEAEWRVVLLRLLW